MGTPDFAVPCLEMLIKEHDVALVISQPDKPKGRGYVMTPPPVKEVAVKNEIPVYQPKSLKTGEALDVIKSYDPDVIVVVAYGKILPKEILELPRYGCINVHASLLPKYRGAAPIQWSVINGDQVTGVTTMYMAEGLDTGDILLKSELEIGENDTAGEVHDKLSILGSELLKETLNKLAQGKLSPIKQNDKDSSYVSMLTKEMGRIDFDKSARQVHDLIRGMNPWPIAFTSFGGKMIKIYESRMTSGNLCEKPGTIICKDDVLVACGEGAIEILEVQPEGKKRMTAKEFANGYRIKSGDLFI